MHMKNILDALSLHFELSLSPDPAKTKYQTMLKKKWYWTDDSTVENTAGLFQRSCSQHTYCLKHQLQGDPGPFSGLHRQLLSHTHSYTDTRHTHNLEQTIKYDWHVLYIDIFFFYFTYEWLHMFQKNVEVDWNSKISPRRERAFITTSYLTAITPSWKFPHICVCT